MKKFTPDELLQLTQGTWLNRKQPQAPLTFAIHDSRLIEPGFGFIAMKGGMVDGHDFLHQAKELGALMAIVERPNQRIELPQLVVSDSLKAWHQLAKSARSHFKGGVIAITGSHGKTSTKDLLHQLLGKEENQATMLNHNGQLGVPKTLMLLDDKKYKRAVIEAGISFPGEMEALASIIQPNAAMVTLVAGNHYAHLKSIDVVAQEKAQLVLGLDESKFVLLHASCMEHTVFKKVKANVWVIGEARDKRLDGVSQVISYTTLEGEGGNIWLRIQRADRDAFVFAIPPMSEGMVSNAVFAISMAQAYDISHELIQSRLDSWTPSYLRGEFRQFKDKLYYVDCYGSSPSSLIDSMGFFRKYFHERTDCLFVLGAMGDLGDQNDDIHFQVGRKITLRSSDRVIMIGSAIKPMIDGMLEAGNSREQLAYFNNTHEAYDMINKFSGVIFLKGGHALRLAELVSKEAKSINVREAIAC